MNLDMTAVGVLISLALNSFNLLANVRSMLSAGEKKLDERLGKVETKLIEYDRRIQTAESDIKHLPDRDATHRMELALSDMNGKFSALEEKLKPIAATSERLHELLMEQAKR